MLKLADHSTGIRAAAASSSAACMSLSPVVPLTKAISRWTANASAASKLAADNVVESFHLSYELPVTIVRIFNVYGPRIGRFLIIPTIILQLLKGSELKLGSLTPTRNFTYVDDIVDAYLLMAEHDSVVGEVVNFGSKRAVTIAELALLIAKLMQREVVISQDDKAIRPAKSEIERVLADVTKANQLLGWRPAVELEDGLKKTIDWIAAGGYDDLPA